MTLLNTENGFVLNVWGLINQNNIAHLYQGKPGEEGGRKFSQFPLFLGVNRFKTSPLLPTVPLCWQWRGTAVCLGPPAIPSGFCQDICHEGEGAHLFNDTLIQTTFANPREENKYVTSTWAPCEPLSFHVSFFILYSLGPHVFPW